MDFSFVTFSIKSANLMLIQQTEDRSGMASFDRKTCVLILIFWICVPTVDIVSDLTMVYKLFKGPDEDLWVSGGHYEF